MTKFNQRETVVLNCTMGENTARMIEMALRLLLQRITEALDNTETETKFEPDEVQLMRQIKVQAAFVADDLATKLDHWPDMESAADTTARFN